MKRLNASLIKQVAVLLPKRVHVGVVVAQPQKHRNVLQRRFAVIDPAKLPAAQLKERKGKKK
jgi:hypothetical protein